MPCQFYDVDKEVDFINKCNPGYMVFNLITTIKWKHKPQMTVIN
mgnify:CR=1 FL=1